MKCRIKKTGEIIDVISLSCDTEGKPTDTVDYIDSKGVEYHNEKLNYYWDLEPIDISNIDWEQCRYEIAKDTLSALNTGKGADCDEKYISYVVNISVKFADLLIKELKKK